MSQTPAYWNGEFCHLEELKIPALDRGYLFGDAVYEVIRVYKGRPFLLTSHLKRLEASLQSTEIQGVLWDQLEARLWHLLDDFKPDAATLYIQISRGAAPRAHLPQKGLKPNELIYLTPLPKDPYAQKRARGMKAVWVPDLRSQMVATKTTNLLPNVLASLAAEREAADTAIFYREGGQITEAVHSNVFVVKKGQVLTPPLGPILPGITREVVLRLASSLGLSVKEKAISIQEPVDEMFLTGTLSEICPVTQVGDKRIGSGPGPITQKLYEAFCREVAIQTSVS